MTSIPEFHPKAHGSKATQFDMGGVPIHSVTSSQVFGFIDQTIRDRQRALVLNVNIHCISLAWKHDWLKEFLNEAQMVFCDGDGPRWGLKLLGYPPPPKIPLTRWIWTLGDHCRTKRHRLFLLGATPGTAELAGQRLKAQFPGLKLVGVHHGYFQKTGEENLEIIDKINRAQPHILIVAFGMPLQEQWLKENAHRLNANILMPGGGVLDYAAGKLGKAPAWMLKLHLEWLFRIWEEPRRLFLRYFIELPQFFISIHTIRQSSKKVPKG